MPEQGSGKFGFVPKKPLLIYDGECRFCCRWIERWKTQTGDRVEYEQSQTAASRHPEIPVENYGEAVQWIGENGEHCSGAEAVFRALATSTAHGRWLLEMYSGSRIFGAIVEGIYGFVARHRMTFSRLTRLLWGDDVRPPTYAVSAWVFLRLLGIIYFIALWSYLVQVDGLVGERGIVPATSFFNRAGEILGEEGFWQLPSFLWWGSGAAAIKMWCFAGMGAALALVAGVFPGPCLVFLWAAYLSLTVGGQVFYQFQWDILLLEAGFLSIFLAPWSWKPGWPSSPPGAARFLLIWLLFRLMFASGVVKLSSGDPSWFDGSALAFHYFTQPLPTPLAWYAQQMPAWFQKLSVWGMFFIELAVPFFLFAPRRLRHAAAGALIALQVGIALTGNYGFFNLLSAALCLLALDDSFWGRFSLRPSRLSPCGTGRKIFSAYVAVAVLILSIVPLASSFRRPMPWLEPLALVYERIAPFRTINGYGLFAVMTKERKEIIVQWSDDGFDWHDIAFKYKPGDVRRAPPWVAPYMPRLDWQMWFAALGDARQNPWFVFMLQRLLEGSPAVASLLDESSLPKNPPRFVRAMSDDYRFTTFDEKSGAWWRSEPAGIYGPEVSLKDF